MKTLKQGCPKVQALIDAAKEALDKLNNCSYPFDKLGKALSAFETTVVATSWDIEDVRKISPEIDDEKAKKVLNHFIDEQDNFIDHQPVIEAIVFILKGESDE